jgi:hypothetical protein
MVRADKHPAGIMDTQSSLIVSHGTSEDFPESLREMNGMYMCIAGEVGQTDGTAIRLVNCLPPALDPLRPSLPRFLKKRQQLAHEFHA